MLKLTGFKCRWITIIQVTRRCCLKRKFRTCLQAISKIHLIEPSGSFSSKSFDISVMDDLFLNRMLFEWLRDL